MRRPGHRGNDSPGNSVDHNAVPYTTNSGRNDPLSKLLVSPLITPYSSPLHNPLYNPPLRSSDYSSNGCPTANPKRTGAISLTYLWLARKEGMDPYSSRYVTYYSSFHLPFPSFVPTLNPKPYKIPLKQFPCCFPFLHSFPANQRPV